MGTIQKTETVPIKNGSDVVFVRQRVRAWTIDMKFSLVDQTKIVTAASELARNTLEYGGGGEVELAMVHNVMRSGLQLAFFRHRTGNSRCETRFVRWIHKRPRNGIGARRKQAIDE